LDQPWRSENNSATMIGSVCCNVAGAGKRPGVCDGNCWSTCSADCPTPCVPLDGFRAFDGTSYNTSSCAPDICPSTFGTGVMRGNNWYRFKGTGGDAIAVRNPGLVRCGTYLPKWISGCDNSISCGFGRANCCAGMRAGSAGDIPGRYPEFGEGRKSMSLCNIDYMFSEFQCSEVLAVRCDGFLLWNFPETDHDVAETDKNEPEYRAPLNGGCGATAACTTFAPPEELEGEV
jgi:hypothetical protein